MKVPMLFGNTISTIEKALDIRARRHELLISNIANADTPGFKAFDIHFEKAMSPESRQFGMELSRTDRMHLLKSTAILSHQIRPQMIDVSKEVTLRGDGNTVDMEREMGSLSENNLMYQLSSHILNKKFQGLLNVIQGGQK